MLNTTLQPRSGGVIFYPREYVINKDERMLSFIKGVTEGGREAVAYIIPEEKFILASKDKDNASTVPTVYDFSRKPGKAKNPCQASKDNSKENPCGVILLEQISLAPELKAQHNGAEVISAKWASVICDGSHESQFAVGVGYLEISTQGKPTAEAVELESRFKEICSPSNNSGLSPLQIQEQKEMLFKQIISKRKKKFTAVILKPELTVEVKEANVEKYKHIIKRALEAFTTKSGMYGGCIVRVRNGDVVDPSCSYVCEHRFSFENKGPDDIEKVLSDFMKFGGMKAFRVGTQQGNILEIIPLQRINCAQNGNNRYSQCLMDGSENSKTLKTFVESEKREDPQLRYKANKAFLFANIACRLSVLDSEDYEGNVLLSAIHAFSAPKGNFLTIDSKGKSAYKLKGQEWKGQGGQVGQVHQQSNGYASAPTRDQYTNHQYAQGLGHPQRH